MKKALNSDRVPKPRSPLSLGIKAGDYVFISGTAAMEVGTYKIIGDSVKEQTKYTLRNILNVLKEDNLCEKDIVKVNVYLSNEVDFEEFNQVYEKYFSDPKPARTTVVCKLVGPFLIEIDCIAYNGKKWKKLVDTIS